MNHFSNVRRIASSGLGLLVAITLGGRTEAVTHNFQLTGSADSARTSSYFAGGTVPEHHDQWYLDVFGLPPTVVRAGDVLNTTVTLDHSLTLTTTAAARRLYFGLNLTSNNRYPDLLVGTSSMVTFLHQGQPVFSSPGPTTTGTVGLIPGSMLLYLEAPISVTYDQVQFHTTVTSMSYALTINAGYLFSDLATPVPEPSPLVGVGLGLAAWGLQARRNRAASHPALPA